MKRCPSCGTCQSGALEICIDCGAGLAPPPRPVLERARALLLGAGAVGIVFVLLVVGRGLT